MTKAQNPFWANWPHEKRLSEAQARTNRLIDLLAPLHMMQESNRLVIYSPILAEQIPKSRAGHAYNQFKRAMHQYAVVRLAAFWDNPAKDRLSLPTIAALFNDPTVIAMAVEQTRAYHANMAEPNTGLDPSDDTPELRQFLTEVWEKERVADGEREAELVGRRLRAAAKAISRLKQSKTSKALTTFRNVYIAHNLKIPEPTDADEATGPLYLWRYGDEEKIIRTTTCIIHMLHQALNGTDFQMQSIITPARSAANELWTNCHFTVPSRASVKPQSKTP